MADTQQVPFDAGTFGSRTTPDMAQRLRRVAAAARELLLDLAAAAEKVERNRLRIEAGRVVDPQTGMVFEFAALTQGQKLTKAITDETPLKRAEDWRIAGRGLAKVNGRDMVTGRHRYASDVKRPGMLHGKVLRPPSFGAARAALDTSAAEAMNGVTVVKDGDFVGVAAPTSHLAESALNAIRCEWKPGESISDRDLFTHLKKTAGASGSGRGSVREGSVEEGLKASDHRLEETYQIAYIAHAPLEPRAAVAEWENGRLTVWTGTQRPFGVRSDLARAFALDESAVRVIVPDTGSGYGGKHTNEAALEAARLARAAGRPVKLVWTREEEFTWAYFRPAGLIEIRSGASKDGALKAWEFHNYNSGASAIRTPYDAPNQIIEFHSSNSPLRQGSYRALASTANTFARETHMDELASALGLDPLEFRLKNLKDERLRAVLEACAGAFGWGRRPESGRGFGIAAGTEKGSYVATCAEVAVESSSGRIRVLRAVSAFECGAVLNPDHLKNQVEGCMMMGLGGALTEAIEFSEGKIRNPNFTDYRVPRFRDAPAMEVVLLDRKDLPSAGAGETPIIGIAPAVGNAIFRASGVRLRSLPMAPRGLKG
jgi:isoquinoline 1-oxidoreductase